MTQSQQLFRDFVVDPDTFWDGNERQASKLRNYFDLLVEKVGGASTTVLDRLEELARARVAHGSPTLFLTSAGSSGSHWLGDALAANGCFSCGEVYYPPKIIQRLAEVDAADRSLFFDQLHLLHSRSLDPQLEQAWVINLAHNARLDKLGELSPRTRRVLLKRDLVDIVLSRTFRKQEYRDYMAAGSSDEAYLESQIGYVQRFYRGAKRTDYDLVVAYEELKKDLAGAVTRVTELLGLELTAEQVRSTCDQLHQTLTQHGKPVQDNRFVGEAAAAPPEIQERIQRDLAQELADWDYPTDREPTPAPAVEAQAVPAAPVQPAPRKSHPGVEKPPASEVVCVIGDERSELASALDLVANHYKSKPSDEFLRGQIRGVARRSLKPRAQALCQGVFELGDFEPVRLPDELTWGEDPLQDRRWLWLFHSWAFTPALLAFGWSEAGAEEAARQRILELALDWSRKNHGQGAPSAMSWHDHATGLRLENLIRIWEMSRQDELVDAEAVQELLLMVVSHCETLSRDDFYSAGTNHGYDQMVALLSASQVFCEIEGAAKWRDLALSRLTEEVRAGFTAEGVHTENSPGYHASMLNRLVDLQQLLQAYGLSLDFDFDGVLDSGLRFLARVTRPDGLMPILGDTQAKPISPAFRKCTDYDSHPLYTFVQTGGEAGEPEDETVSVYEESGYAIFRDAWRGQSGVRDTVHCVFKCGHLSHYHRQDDDLNLVLYAHGGDWLIDAGLYRYEEKEERRKFVRSDLAHNIPRLAGVAARRKVPDEDRRPTLRKVTEDGSSVAATTNIYAGFEVRRTVDFAGSSIRIHDVITEQDALLAKRLQAIEILFHVPSGIAIEVDGQKVVCRRSDGRTMTLENVSGADCVIDHAEGGASEEIPSWISTEYGEIEASQVVRFTLASESRESVITLQLS